jgi:hypothetical protein
MERRKPMRNVKKTILIALAIVLLLGTTPAFAQWWVGNWEGEGSGLCDNGYIKIYPWQRWNGSIVLATPGVFEGEWEDVITSKTGTFYLEFIEQGNYWVDFSGYWKWIDPDSGDTIYGGPAKMTFYNSVDDYCKGAWDAVSFPPNAIPREMRGRRY